MAYRMEELTDTVRVGIRSDGFLDIEVWECPHGWKVAFPTKEPEEIFLPPDAIEALFEYLR